MMSCSDDHAAPVLIVKAVFKSCTADNYAQICTFRANFHSRTANPSM